MWRLTMGGEGNRFLNKWYAIITLWHLVNLLDNWPTVWMCNHKRIALPPFTF